MRTCLLQCIVVLVSACALAACGESHDEAPPPETPRHDARGRHARTMPFVKWEGAKPGFHCMAPGLPEEKAGGAECFHDAATCSASVEHLATSYGVVPPSPPCQVRKRAHCFDMRSWGKVLEVCRTTAPSCAEHHRIETRDDRVSEITVGCEER